MSTPSPSRLIELAPSSSPRRPMIATCRPRRAAATAGWHPCRRDPTQVAPEDGFPDQRDGVDLDDEIEVRATDDGDLGHRISGPRRLPARTGASPHRRGSCGELGASSSSENSPVEGLDHHRALGGDGGRTGHAGDHGELAEEVAGAEGGDEAPVAAHMASPSTMIMKSRPVVPCTVRSRP